MNMDWVKTGSVRMSEWQSQRQKRVSRSVISQRGWVVSRAAADVLTPWGRLEASKEHAKYDFAWQETAPKKQQTECKRTDPCPSRFGTVHLSTHAANRFIAKNSLACHVGSHVMLKLNGGARTTNAEQLVLAAMLLRTFRIS